jgi:hypothetical protein
MEFGIDRFFDHQRDALTEIVVEQFGLLGPDRIDYLEGEVHVHRLVAEDPVRSCSETVEQPLAAQEVHIGEGGEEEQTLNACGEADQVHEEPFAILFGLQRSVGNIAHPLETELGLGPDRGDVLDGGEGFSPFVVIGDVVIEKVQVELNVQRLFVELSAQVHPGFGRVDVLVEVEHQVVGHDRVAGGEERHETTDQVLLGRHQLAIEVGQIVGEVDLFDGPRVLDRVFVHLEELRIPHRPQREVEAGVEDVGLGAPLGGMTECRSVVRRGSSDLAKGGIFCKSHQSHASHASGFSSEQAMASSSVNIVFSGTGWPPPFGPPPGVVVLLIRVAGRERR